MAFLFCLQRCFRLRFANLRIARSGLIFVYISAFAFIRVARPGVCQCHEFLFFDSDGVTAMYPCASSLPLFASQSGHLRWQSLGGFD